MNYSYETQKWVALGSFEHYDPEFRMATAFINRIGITSGWAFVDRSFYPDKTRYPWIRRLSILSFTQGGRDVVAGGNDLLEVAGMRFNFTRQGFLRVDRTFGFEHWQGERFDRGRLRAFGNVQLYRWLFLEGNVNGGLSVFYDSIDPFQGRSRSFSGGFRLQPDGRFQQSINWNRVGFDREATGVRVYTVHIVNARTTYQFTRAFSLRGIAQYRQLTVPDSGRLSRFLRTPARHRRLRGLRIAPRRAPVHRRPVDRRQRIIRGEPARPVLQDLLPASLLSDQAVQISDLRFQIGGSR